jgi:hypothetical protein
MKTLEEKQSELEAYTTVGNKVTVECRETPGTYRTIGEVVDEVYAMSHGYKHLVQRIHQIPEAREDGEEYAYPLRLLCAFGQRKKGFRAVCPGAFTTRAAAIAQARARKRLANLPLSESATR